MLPHMSSSRRTSSRARTGLLGLGLDGKDGHQRVTRGEDFLLLGGSQETHECMEHVVLRMRDQLKRKGKTFKELSKEEFTDLAREALE